MKSRIARGAAAAVCVCALMAVACGKRGNPLPPLQRLPAPPTDLVVSRFDDQVFVRLTVPATNIDGVRPSVVARVEVYALTLDRDPRVLSDLTPEQVRKLSTLVASEQVRRPLPPPPPPKDGAPPAPETPPEPGVDQGAVIVLRETLDAAARVPVDVPRKEGTAPGDREQQALLMGPLVAPLSAAGPERYYYAVAVSDRGRYSPHSGMLPAPVGPVSGPPSKPEVEVAETSATLRWAPPADARGQTAPADPALLPSRPLIQPPPATTYEVYEVKPEAPSTAAIEMPAPLSPSPVSAPEWTQSNITLGAERCFQVRAVDTIDGHVVRGPASPAGCAPFTDTFPPSPPRDLLAASVPGAINLIWEPSAAKDAAGYLVLRGEAGSATLTALNTTPTTELRYRDETVKSGTRYAYAIVAVDNAGNKSSESERVEETAR